MVSLYNGMNGGGEGGDRSLPAGWPGPGLALFDRVDPARILDRLDRPFLKVDRDWERKGFTNDAVVSNGLAFFRGEWLLYYGAADRRIGLAVFRPPTGVEHGGAEKARRNTETDGSQVQEAGKEAP
jgi:hypothetical protein